jgi:hypothetical protein
MPSLRPPDPPFGDMLRRFRRRRGRREDLVMFSLLAEDLS